MEDLKYIISKLDESFFGKSLSFLKTRNSFNKIYKEYKEKQESSDQVYNLLYPLKNYFEESYKILNGKYSSKEEKEEILYGFLDNTEMVVLFWTDNFDDFEILMKGLNPLHRKFKYLRKNYKNFS